MTGYLLGVDGGNTKTIALVAATDGSILGAARGGCGDIYGSFATMPRPVAAVAALDTIERTVRGALDAAALDADDLLAGAFSLAGADWPEDIALLRAAMIERGFGRRVSVVNDAIGALRAGSPTGLGVSVVCGTGGAVGARGPDGREWHASHWLESFGAVALAEAMLRAVFRADLGIDPPTALTRRALDIAGVGRVEQLLHRVTAHEGGAHPEPGALVHALLDEAHAGDATACRVVRAHGEGLAEYALVGAGSVGLRGGPFALVLAGGVLHHWSPLLGEAVVARVRVEECGAQPVRGVLPPAAGALLLAADAAGVVADAALATRLAATLPPSSLFATHTVG